MNAPYDTERKRDASNAATTVFCVRHGGGHVVSFELAGEDTEALAQRSLPYELSAVSVTRVYCAAFIGSMTPTPVFVRMTGRSGAGLSTTYG